MTEAAWGWWRLLLGGHEVVAFVCLMVQGFVFDGWNVTTSGVKPAGVVPMHPLGSGPLDVAPVFPSCTLEVDELGLIETDG